MLFNPFRKAELALVLTALLYFYLFEDFLLLLKFALTKM